MPHDSRNTKVRAKCVDGMGCFELELEREHLARPTRAGAAHDNVGAVAGRHVHRVERAGGVGHVVSAQVETEGKIEAKLKAVYMLVSSA
jgi:hypothetical protein